MASSCLPGNHSSAQEATCEGVFTHCLHPILWLDPADGKLNVAIPNQWASQYHTMGLRGCGTAE